MMELSMSMRFVRIRARQIAQNGPVLAEHTMSALLLLAGSEAQTVMPSGTDTAKAAIAEEIADLRKELDVLFGIGNPLPVKDRLDDLIGARELDAGADREYAALQSDAEKWMMDNPALGDTIVPVAMLHAVYKKTDMIVDEAMMSAGSDAAAEQGAPTAPEPVDAEATIVDETIYDPQVTVVDFTPIIEDEQGIDSIAEENVRREAEEANRREAEEAALREAAEAGRLAAEEAGRRAAEEAAKREAEEAKRQAVLQQAVLEAQNRILREQLEEKNRKKKGGSANAKAVGIFIVFAIVVFAVWQVYLRAEMFGADPSSWYMKLAFFAVYLIAFIVSLRRFSLLQNDPSVKASQTTMMRMRVVGTAGMIYFRTVIISTIVPAVLLLIIYLVLGELTTFWYHFMAIYVFCWLCGLVNLAFQSNVAALSVGDLSWEQLKKKKGAMTGMSVSGVLTVPAFVLFLHWHFDWFPMKTWVIVLLIIYLVIGLISVISMARMNLGMLQNKGQ